MASQTTEWGRIRKMRTDMSDYVMHCTRQRWDAERQIMLSPYEVLKEILGDGFLRATFVTHDRSRPGVRGPFPAVCFTEQPLRFFIQSVEASWEQRYTEFAVAFRKDDLFSYGGRPVIYSDDSALGRLVTTGEEGQAPWVYEGGLSAETQHLWVNYNPTALWDRPYPVDWTHEREWRARPDYEKNRSVGLRGVENLAVPVRLLTERSRASTEVGFIVLVDTDQRRMELQGWIDANVACIASTGAYSTWYAEALGRCPILSFETIKAALDASQGLLGRLEDYYQVLEE